MIKNKYSTTLFFLFLCCFIYSQTKTLQGKVNAPDDVEGIHVLNKTSSKYTITDEKGNFLIPAKLLDTLTISGIKYKTETVIITKAMMDKEALQVTLIEEVNVLDEIIVGKILTGSLISDIGNSDAKAEINFYDLGIPGYTGKPLTQSERRVVEATTGGGIIPLNPILNWISGRTKKLKNRVKIEDLNKCLQQLKSEYSNAIFETETLKETLREEYFQFCLDDPEFNTICEEANTVKQLEYLLMKLKKYKKNLQEKEED